jgi:phage tail sheath gpL-like
MSDSNSIVVPGYPSTNRVPGVFASIDPSKSNTGSLNQRTLILGQMTSSGNAIPGVPILSAGVGDAVTACGVGSMISIAVERYRALDLTGELWLLPLADDNLVGAAATFSITLVGPSTAVGAIPLYINGTRTMTPVNSGDTATTMGANMATAINGYTSPAGNPLPVIATAAAGVVTVTARNKGTLGNQTTLLLSFGGTAAGEGQRGTTNVAGVTATIAAVTPGTIDPSIATALANLPDQPFDFICCPYADPTSTSALAAFLGDAAGRWNWSVQLFGHGFTAKNGTLSARTTWSLALNSQHISAIGAYGSPSPDWYWAVDFTAVHAVSIRSDPTLPIGGLVQGDQLNVVAPPLQDLDNFAARQTMLFDGISSFKGDINGLVYVDRSITTYQQNASGLPDNSYLSTNTPFQLMAYIRSLETMLGSNFNQSILVADGSRIPAGSALVTSQTILFSAIAHYTAIATTGLPGAPVGLVQNPTVFAAGAQAQNAGGGIVKLLLPIILGTQLIAIAINVQFRANT